MRRKMANKMALQLYFFSGGKVQMQKHLVTLNNGFGFNQTS